MNTNNLRIGVADKISKGVFGLLNFIMEGYNMELSSLSQYGLSAIFIVASYRFYNDMRSDSLKREEKLMEHLGKVSDTLEKIDARLCALEKDGDKK